MEFPELIVDKYHSYVSQEPNILLLAVPKQRIPQVFQISYRPITVKGLLRRAPHLFKIFLEGELKPVDKKVCGKALGTLYKMENECYLGKINIGTDFFEDDNTLSLAQMARKELSLAAILEKLGHDFYKELGRGLFKVPATRLSIQKLQNVPRSPIIEYTASIGVEACLRILSQFPAYDGYHSFSEAKTLNVSKNSISFLDYIQKYERTPDTLLTPQGKEVPLYGLVELLAVMQVLGDKDGLGSSGEKAGFIWTKDGHGEIKAAKTVKIECDGAFSSFKAEAESIRALYELRDIQIADTPSMFLRWEQMTKEQKGVFLTTLTNCLRYRNNQDVIRLLVDRDKKFNRSATEELPQQVADHLTRHFTTSLDRLEAIYQNDLLQLQRSHPELLLCIHYLDRCGEISLPACRETYPAGELYTKLLLVRPTERTTSQIVVEELSDPIYERDSLKSLIIPTQMSGELEITLPDLFAFEEGRPIKKVGVLGLPGIGKSVLCMGIAHRWASRELWSHLKAIYWLPLRLCNTSAALENEDDPFRWLAKAMAELVLERPDVTNSFLQQLQDYPEEILVMLDGNDESRPHVAMMVQKLLTLPHLNFLITSRPGALPDSLERVVETRGFSPLQIEKYAHRFFERGERTPIHAQEQSLAFLKVLKAHSVCSLLSSIPLQLQMLCKIWEKSRAAGVGLPATVTRLYQVMIQELVDWHQQKPVINIDLLVGSIALKGLNAGQLLISEEVILEELANFPAISEEQLLACGLLKRHENGVYSFLHLTFQEYAVAELISHWTIEEQKEFVLLHRHHPQYQQVFAFLAGILSQKEDDLASMKQFLEWLHMPGADLVGIYQYTLVLRCLGQCLKPEIYQWAEDTYKIKKSLLTALETAVYQNTRATWVTTLLNQIPLMTPEVVEATFDLLINQFKAGFGPYSQHLLKTFLSQKPTLVPSAIAALKSLLKKQSPVIRNKPEVGKKFGKVVGNPLHGVSIIGTRQAVVSTFIHLINIGSSELISETMAELKLLFDGESESVRCWVVESLASMPKSTSPEISPHVITILKKALQDKSNEVRGQALEFWANLSIESPLFQDLFLCGSQTMARHLNDGGYSSTSLSKFNQKLIEKASPDQLLQLFDDWVKAYNVRHRGCQREILEKIIRITPPSYLQKMLACCENAVKQERNAIAVISVIQLMIDIAPKDYFSDPLTELPFFAEDLIGAAVQGLSSEDDKEHHSVLESLFQIATIATEKQVMTICQALQKNIVARSSAIQEELFDSLSGFSNTAAKKSWLIIEQEKQMLVNLFFGKHPYERVDESFSTLLDIVELKRCRSYPDCYELIFALCIEGRFAAFSHWLRKVGETPEAWAAFKNYLQGYLKDNNETIRYTAVFLTFTMKGISGILDRTPYHMTTFFNELRLMPTNIFEGAIEPWLDERLTSEERIAILYRLARKHLSAQPFLIFLDLAQMMLSSLDPEVELAPVHHALTLSLEQDNSDGDIAEFASHCLDYIRKIYTNRELVEVDQISQSSSQEEETLIPLNIQESSLPGVEDPLPTHSVRLIDDWQNPIIQVVQSAIEQNAPLYIEFSGNQAELCVVQTGHKRAFPVSEAQLQYLQKVCVEESPMNLYTANYLCTNRETNPEALILKKLASLRKVALSKIQKEEESRKKPNQDSSGCILS